MHKPTEQVVRELTEYFSHQNEVAFAFLFGSLSDGRVQEHSDIDVGVYFVPAGELWELEDTVYFPGENRIWGEIGAIAGRETDLVVLNRSPAILVYTVLATGTPLGIKNPSLYLTIYLQANRMIEEYLNFTESFLAINNRSTSLTPLDRERVIRILDFLQEELQDRGQFIHITYAEFTKNSAFRRNVERWIENLVNASLDIAKILVASEKQPLPQTYRETILRLKTIPDFPIETVDSVANNIRLRNILAQEYLDLRFPYVETFIQSAELSYGGFRSAVRRYLESHPQL